MLGVWCAEENMFARLRQKACKSRWRTVGYGAAVLCCCAALALMRMGLPASFHPFVDGALALCIACFCFLAFSGNFLGDALAFLGRHSANIFFTHQFFITYQFRAFFYSLRYPVFIVAATAAATLLLSMGIEALKKLVRWNVLRDWIACKAANVA